MFLLFLLFVAIIKAQIPADKISSLPLYNGSLGNQYSGYIEVSQKNGRYLHYWFVESQSNPSTDPLVLWLNGGPGCSSLDGLFYEHGPVHFAPTAKVQLVDNPWSWNKVANVIYLEAPAGVGFSYSNTESDYSTDDNQTAIDNYEFLKLWLKKNTQFRKNDFYIAGESYAGMYVPWLAREVLQGNLKKSFVINFKGVLVGNGVANDPSTDLEVTIPFLYGHGIISTNLNSAITQACGKNPSGDQCSNLQQEAFSLSDGYNPYGIYYDCASQRPLPKIPSSPLRVAEQVPCVDSAHADVYLNTRAVQHAIHVKTSITWSICSDLVDFNGSPDPTLPIYQSLLSHGIRVLIYSGDTDMMVPYTDSEWWTTHAGFTESSAWHPWFYTDLAGQQVAGMATEYAEGLTFVTVKGSGHMVPQYAPQKAYAMFTTFLSGQSF
eukprot:TRINITY_DN4273_c0_g1_i4.p1 TRINITY_DN4273_c0_g1~~TRINITY_DN4273_c0_g1_i4.p1  ORF type:complete len:435 (-),score=60.36 TRINITY_DN4273_c0_g1_i4:102-1406(-)